MPVATPGEPSPSSSKEADRIRFSSMGRSSVASTFFRDSLWRRSGRGQDWSHLNRSLGIVHDLGRIVQAKRHHS